MARTEHGTISAAGGAVVEYNEDARGSQDLNDVETHDEAKKSSDTWVYWQGEITAALAAESRFRDEGEQAEVDYFGDDSKAYTTKDYQKEENRTNVVHANIEVLKPLVFSETPDPIVRRRFGGDGADNDPTDRISALVTQRMAKYCVDTSGFKAAMELARNDWLVPGRGTARVMYKAEFKDQPVTDPQTGAPVVDPMTNSPVLEKVKINEKIKVRHWPWRRHILAAANCWDDLPWMSFEREMTKKEIADRFDRVGPDGEMIKLSEKVNYPNDGLKGSSKNDPEADEKAGWKDVDNDDISTGARSISAHDTCTIHEIWDRREKKVIWFSPDYQDDILDEIEDPLGLEDFFHCPKPLLSVTKNGNMNPRPDTAFYRSRADEIDLATKKLSGILKSISVSGLFPGKMKDEVQKLLNGTSNKMIPVEEWMAFIESGGIKELIHWFPIDKFIQAAQALIQMREQSKMALYEISGISDIVRGQSDPNETLGAQQIKGNYANLRLRDKQSKMHEFARDTIQIMVEIGLEHFDTKTIIDIVNISGIPETEDALMEINRRVDLAKQQHAQIAQMAQQAGQPVPPEPEIPFYEKTSWERIRAGLKNDMIRKFALSIETDGTILQDQEEDKKNRVEFLQAFSSMSETLFPMAQSGIVEMKVIKEMLLFAVRGFPKSRTLEGMLESLPDDINTDPPEDSSVTVANIKAESDKLLKEMELGAKAQEADKERSHETRLKGVDVIVDNMARAIEN